MVVTFHSSCVMSSVLLMVLFIRLRLSMYTVNLWLSHFTLLVFRVVLLMILFIRLRLGRPMYTVSLWLSRLILLVLLSYFIH